MAAQRDPIRDWREQFARRVLNVDFEPLSDGPFRASIKPIFERIMRTAHSPGTTFRDEALVKDGDDRFSLLISQSRNLDVAHHRRELRLGRGDATLMHLCEIGSVGSCDDVGFIAVMVPNSELTARCAGLGGAVMQRLPRQSEALQLLRAYIVCLEKGRFDPSGEARDTICRHVIDLVVLAATPHRPIGESSTSPVVAARLAAALDHITSCFQDPELSLATVAGSLRISPRYLQRLLETSGTSFTARVNELRLQRAFTLLTDGACRISDVALQISFSDISHFNQLFRSRFGDTPRGVRGRGRRANSHEV
jgi:AraC-like DNA-binding protein